MHLALERRAERSATIAITSPLIAIAPIIISVIAASTRCCWRRQANSSSSGPACSISASKA
jgi:hypothetical protein